MRELKARLLEFDEKTNWLRIMQEVEKPEVQIQIRAEIGRAIKRIDKELERKR